jgi:hypothetical protein
MLSQAKSGNQSEIKTVLTLQLFTLYHNTQYARHVFHFKQITEWQMMPQFDQLRLLKNIPSARDKLVIF